MKKEEKYKNHIDLPDNIESVIATTQIHWKKDREQIWIELQKKIEAEDKANPVARTISINRPRLMVAAAAVFALLVGITALVSLYTKTIVAPVGLHSEVYLPDKSLVKLNSQSSLTYKPLAWRFSRKVIFDGEAYFEVKKGKQFNVISEKGTTIVLGTSFNIYSRDDDYRVTCLTGKVKVQIADGNQEVILDPGQQTLLNAEGILTAGSDTDTEQTLSWLNDKFSFTSAPLVKVFEEIGRQYGVMIKVPAGLDNSYTGTFIKDSSVENVLNLVCKPFDLSFSRKSDNEYIISGNKQKPVI